MDELGEQLLKLNSEDLCQGLPYSCHLAAKIQFFYFHFFVLKTTFKGFYASNSLI